MRTNKQYFLYYLKENILLFDVFDYIEEIAADSVDYCSDWNLIRDGKVTCKKKVIKEYFESCILVAKNEINKRISKNRCNIICFYQEKSLNSWKDYFEDPNSVIKVAKTLLKKNLLNFIETKSTEMLFQDVQGSFFGLPCVIPTGEDEEFLTKSKKRLFKPLDKYIPSR
jgi:hypothetical protein